MMKQYLIILFALLSMGNFHKAFAEVVNMKISSHSASSGLPTYAQVDSSTGKIKFDSAYSLDTIPSAVNLEGYTGPRYFHVQSEGPSITVGQEFADGAISMGLKYDVDPRWSYVYQYSLTNPTEILEPYGQLYLYQAWPQVASYYPTDDTVIIEDTVYCSICGVSIPPHYEVSCNFSDRLIHNDSSVYPMAYRVALYRAGGEFYCTLEAGIMDPDPFAAGSPDGIRQGHPLSDYGMIPFCLIPKVETWLIPAGLSAVGLDMADPLQWSPGIAGDYDFSDMNLPSAVLDVTSTLESSGSVVYAGEGDYSDFAAQVAALEGSGDYVPYYPDGQTVSFENVSATDDVELQTDLDNQAGVPDAYQDGGLRDIPPPPEGLSAADMAAAVRAGTLGGFGSVVSALGQVQSGVESVNSSGFGDVVAGLSGVQASIDGMVFDSTPAEPFPSSFEVSNLPDDITIDDAPIVEEPEPPPLTDEVNDAASERIAMVQEQAAYSVQVAGELVTVHRRELESLVPAAQAFGTLLQSAVSDSGSFTLVDVGAVQIGGVSWPPVAVVWELQSGIFSTAKTIFRAVFAFYWYVLGFAVLIRLVFYWNALGKA